MYSKKYNIKNKNIFENNFTIEPKNGMLLLFPSIVNHEVPPSKGKRIVASFNLLFTP